MSLLTSLSSYWKLDAASGNESDSHGSNTLVDNNTVGSGTGKIGNARDFERDSSEFLEVADAANLSGSALGGFAGSVWIKLESLPASVLASYVVVSKGRIDQAANLEYALYINDNDGLAYLICSNGSSVDQIGASTFGALSAGVWYHIIFWHDNSTDSQGISVNGVADTESSSVEAGDTTQPFRIGADSSGRYFDGLIDEVGFWQRALTSDERTELYNGGSGRAYPFGIVSASATSAPSTSDAATRALSAPRSATSAPSTSDAATRALVLSRALAETPSTSDAAARVLALPRTLAEAPSTSDAASATRTVPRDATESPSTADAASRQVTLARPLSDSPSTADAASATKASLRDAASSPSTSDSAAPFIAAARAASESPSTADVAASVVAAVRSAASGPSTSDACDVVSIVAIRTASAAPSTADTITVAAVLARSASSSPSTSDAAVYVTFLPQPIRLKYAVPAPVALSYAVPVPVRLYYAEDLP